MRKSLLAFLIVCGVVASAQTPFVPEDRIERSRRLQDDRVVFCIVTGAPTTEFDRSVATALASSLLIEAEFYDVPSDFPVYEAEDFLYAIYILLVDHCNAFIGMNLAPEAYPDWLTFTRAYAQIPFVLAVTSEQYSNLGDIPKDQPIGASMLSRADSQFINYLQTLPRSQRWQRYPYADQSLMLTRLLDGSIAGAFFWAPDLKNLLAEKPEVDNVRTIPANPLQQTDANLGIAMLAQDTYLRTTLDQAISASVEDGTMQQLLEMYGLSGNPGENAP